MVRIVPSHQRAERQGAGHATRRQRLRRRGWEREAIQHRPEDAGRQQAERDDGEARDLPDAFDLEERTAKQTDGRADQHEDGTEPEDEEDRLADHRTGGSQPRTAAVER